MTNLCLLDVCVCSVMNLSARTLQNQDLKKSELSESKEVYFVNNLYIFIEFCPFIHSEIWISNSVHFRITDNAKVHLNF